MKKKIDKNIILSVQHDPRVIKEIEQLVKELSKHLSNSPNRVSKSKLIRSIVNVGLEQIRSMSIPELADFIRE